MNRARLLRTVVPVAAGVALIGTVAGTYAASRARIRVVGAVPGRLADTTFWRMFSEMSEPGGYFRSDNFVSNESAYQFVIPTLERRIKPGGAYLGVGPDQNFTYLAAFRPGIAFIVDIRRQNAMQHLMYKALIEASADRADFLSRLFSRPRPPGLDTNSSVAQLLAAYAKVRAVGEQRDTVMDLVSRLLRITHGFPISDEDFASIEYVHGAFYESGPDLRYASGQQGFRGSGGRMARRSFARRFPSYAELMQETDGQGVARSYLATERAYRLLRDMESRNVIVPVVGDFAGQKALRAVGRWLKEHDAPVTVFYTSNVEQYLFEQDDDWSKFYDNVAKLPIDSASTFIRSVSSRMRVQSQHPSANIAQLVQPIDGLLRAHRARRVRNYRDVIAMSAY